MLEPTSSKIASLVELGEAKAWMNYYTCACAPFTLEYRVAVRLVGSVYVTMIPQVDMSFFNRINALGIDSPATEAMLDDALGVLQHAGCTSYMVQLSPAATPPQLAEWLTARGLRRSRNWAKMYRGNAPASAVQTDLRIQRVGREYADAFGEITLTNFEMPLELRPFMSCHIGKPGWLHFLAFDGKHPVAAAAMYVSGDVAWLGFGSTLPSHRGRGAQSSLFFCRIEEALRLGVKWFITETGEETPERPNPSYHNMLRAGFRLAYLRPNYVHES